MKWLKFAFRKPYGIVLSIVILLFCAASGEAQQSESVVVEGKSIDSIRIGESSEADVIAAYGTEYKLIRHREYSYELSYRSLGLRFYYCAADPKKEIFVISIEEPARVITNRGIRLGESSMEDVFRLYGKPEKPSAGFEYEGVDFNVARESLDQEKEEEILEPTGEETEELKAESDALQQGVDTSNIWIARISQPTYFDPVDRDEATKDIEITTADEPKDEEAKILESVKTKIVRQIELIEKTGLRQCDTKFEPNK